MTALMTGLDLGPISVGPTPLAILIICLVVALSLFVLASQAGGALVDRRWSANEPLTPSEVVSPGAEDYLATMALGMSADDDGYVVDVRGAYFEGDVARAAAAAGGSWSAPCAGGSGPS